MRFGSVCSGIEAASVAWHPIGWRAAWLAEIEPFPSAVLAHHYPDVPNLGDMTTIGRRVLTGEVEAPEVLTGGTPCQAFSVAGLRESLADERGNLTLKFVELADAIDHVRRLRSEQPAVIIWENVPGVLSTTDNAFGCFLAGLAGEDEPLQPAGKKWANAGAVYGPARAVAWRTLDAQYFGVAQRRRRVFVVASARAGFDPAAVLFEFDGVRRDTAPSREARQGAAAGTAAGAASRGNCREVAPTLDAQMDRKWGSDQWTNNGFAIIEPAIMSSGQANAEVRADGGAPALTCLHEAPIVTHSLRGEGFDASEDGTGRGTPLVPVAGAICRDSFCGGMGGKPEGAAAGHVLPVAFQPTQDPISTTCLAANSPPPALLTAMQVRRLTPRECERLQGFPDDYTLIPWRGKPADQCPDGPRYKALGNSWAVPVARWIGRRVDAALRGRS